MSLETVPQKRGPEPDCREPEGEWGRREDTGIQSEEGLEEVTLQ